jgi:uncharacterized protein YbjT (DUF2867 family)
VVVPAGRNVLIAGSSGFIGGLLLRRVLAEPGVARVACLVRRPLGAAAGKARSVVTDFSAPPEDLDDAYHAVFLCLGPTAKRAGSPAEFHRVEHDLTVTVARWAAERGAYLCAYVSSVGADPRSRNFYLRTKGETEASLAAIGFTALHCFRPSFLTGRPEFNWRERAGAFASNVFYKLPPRSGIFKPIAGMSVANALAACLGDRRSGVHVHHYGEIVAAAI